LCYFSNVKNSKSLDPIKVGPMEQIDSIKTYSLSLSLSVQLKYFDSQKMNCQRPVILLNINSTAKKEEKLIDVKM